LGKPAVFLQELLHKLALSHSIHQGFLIMQVGPNLLTWDLLLPGSGIYSPFRHRSKKDHPERLSEKGLLVGRGWQLALVCLLYAHCAHLKLRDFGHRIKDRIGQQIGSSLGEMEAHEDYSLW